ncbi:MAG: hypothetical protein N3G19_00025 [Candidatus Pacearchaeota archaeon]|nr:hypothetical protein [Candidatus Pacearchaeota archaeon]
MKLTMPCNLEIKVLIDKGSTTSPAPILQYEIKRKKLENLLPEITKAFDRLSKAFNKKMYINQKGEIVKGEIKNRPTLKLNLYVAWCKNYENFLHSKDGKLVAYGGKKENRPYIIRIKQEKFFIDYI